jgi:hypothetical protein
MGCFPRAGPNPAGVIIACLCLLSQPEGRDSGGSDGNGNGNGARGGGTRAAFWEPARAESLPRRRQVEIRTVRLLFSKGVWRNSSASDSRSEGWEFESLCPHFVDWPKGMVNDARKLLPRAKPDFKTPPGRGKSRWCSGMTSSRKPGSCQASPPIAAYGPAKSSIRATLRHDFKEDAGKLPSLAPHRRLRPRQIFNSGDTGRLLNFEQRPHAGPHRGPRGY